MTAMTIVGRRLGRIRNVAIIVACLGATVSCAGPLRGMREVTTPVDATPPPGKAAVVFMRPSTFGAAIASSVYEVHESGDVFIGILPAKRKLVHFTEPRATRFMVIGESADFMGAELEAGKTYYALVTPRMGVWKARFSLRPVTPADQREFGEWFADCAWVENTTESREWAKQHWADIMSKKAEYVVKWDAKPDKPILRPADAR